MTARCVVTDYVAEALASLPADFGAVMREGIVYVRALALWQPFASLVADGLKPIETRLHSTRVRGRFVVTATKQLAPLGDYARVLDRLTAAGIDVAPYLPQNVPRGCALGVAELVGCRPMTPIDEPQAWVSARTDAGGDRYAWQLAPDPLRLRQPFPVKSKQGWFRIDASPLVGRAA